MTVTVNEDGTIKMEMVFFVNIQTADKKGEYDKSKPNCDINFLIFGL